MPSSTFRVVAAVPAERTWRDGAGAAVTLPGVGVRAVPVEDPRWADLEGWFADSANGQVGVTVFERLDQWKVGFEFDALLQAGSGPPGATYVVAKLATVSRTVPAHGWLPSRTLRGLKVTGTPERPMAGAAVDVAGGFYSNAPGGAVGFTVFDLASAAFRLGALFHFLVTPRRAPAPAPAPPAHAP